MPAESVSWTEPPGGCTLWLRVETPRHAGERALVERARDEGVAITPGSFFFPGPPDSVGFRLSIAKTRAHEIDEGCRRLARALAPATSRRR